MAAKVATPALVVATRAAEPIALSAAVHHSFDKVSADAKYSGQRAEKTGQGRGCERRSTETEAQRSQGDGALPVLRGRARRESASTSEPPVAAARGAEQVIEVPGISCPARRPLRAVLAATQMAEQLVEVSWVSPSSCVLVPQIGNEVVDV